MRLLSAHRIKQNPGNPCPPEIFEMLVAIPVPFLNLGIDKVDAGIIEIHRDLADDIEEGFALMLQERFPLVKVLPIARWTFFILKTPPVSRIVSCVAADVAQW